MKRTLTGVLAALVITAGAVGSAQATPGKNTCSGCHGVDGAVIVQADFMECVGNDASYGVSVSNTNSGIEAWAVFASGGNIRNGEGNGNFTVPAGKTYEVWGVSFGPGMGGSNFTTITPDCTQTQPPPGDVCTDDDGDGFFLEGGACGVADCDDTDKTINPDAVEVCGDGIDNNCNGKADEGCAAGPGPETIVNVLTADGVLVGTTMTDGHGNFVFENLEGGSFVLEVLREGALNASIVFEIPADKAPARLLGEVETGDEKDVELEISRNDGCDDDGEDGGDGGGENCGDDGLEVISLEIEAELYPMSDEGDVIVQRLAVQRKWSVRWTRSRGSTKAIIRGRGVKNISAVTLTAAEGSVDAYRVKIVPRSRKAIAYFEKSKAIAALGSVSPGNTVEVTVGLTSHVGTQDFVRNVRVVGNKGKKR